MLFIFTNVHVTSCSQKYPNNLKIKGENIYLSCISIRTQSFQPKKNVTLDRQTNLHVSPETNCSVQWSLVLLVYSIYLGSCQEIVLPLKCTGISIKGSKHTRTSRNFYPPTFSDKHLHYLCSVAKHSTMQWSITQLVAGV